MGVKSALQGIGKVAAAMVVAVVALGGIVWGITTFNEHRERSANAPLMEPEIWPAVSIGAPEKSELHLSTIWTNGQLSFQLRLAGYPSELKNAMDGAARSLSSITLIFLDAHGFKVFDHQIFLSSVSRNVDDKGQPIGVELQDNFYVSADDYRRAKHLQASWNF